jgi:hypothetical protein
MDLLQFHRMRTAVQINASPGHDDDLMSVEDSLRELLMSSGVFEEVEVGTTDNPDQLVIALCKFNPYFSEADVARHLERIWRERLSYPFWEAHALHVENDHVEFEAASRHSSGGHYVTVHLVAQKGRIPAQRAASE